MVNPTLYLLFLGIAVPTVLTPGPGVLMSLTNSIRLGVPRATPGIIGVALGTLMIAALSATAWASSLRLRLRPTMSLSSRGWSLCSTWAGSALMQIRISSGLSITPAEKNRARPRPVPLRLFGEGIVLQLSNPQLIIFYLSLFPQCIDANKPYWPQFVFLSLSYTLLVWIIHSCYGWMGHKAAERFMTQKNCIWINRISGIAFWLCALWLLYSLVAG